MNLVNFFQEVTWFINFRVVSETGENCNLFNKCIFDDIPQLGLIVSLYNFFVIFERTLDSCS